MKVIHLVCRYELNIWLSFRLSESQGNHEGPGAEPKKRKKNGEL
jgi:hypothetical protein